MGLRPPITKEQVDLGRSIIASIDRSHCVTRKMAGAAEVCFEQFVRGGFGRPAMGATGPVGFVRDSDGWGWPWMSTVLRRMCFNTVAGWAIPDGIPALDGVWDVTYGPENESRVRDSAGNIAAGANNWVLADLEDTKNISYQVAAELSGVQIGSVGKWMRELIEAWSEVLSIYESAETITGSDSCGAVRGSDCCAAHRVASGLQAAAMRASEVHSSKGFLVSTAETDEYMHFRHRIAFEPSGVPWNMHSEVDLWNDPFGPIAAGELTGSLLDKETREWYVIEALAANLNDDSGDRDLTAGGLRRRITAGTTATLEMLDWWEELFSCEFRSAKSLGEMIGVRKYEG